MPAVERPRVALFSTRPGREIEKYGDADPASRGWGHAVVPGTGQPLSQPHRFLGPLVAGRGFGNYLVRVPTPTGRARKRGPAFPRADHQPLDRAEPASTSSQWPAEVGVPDQSNPAGATAGRTRGSSRRGAVYLGPSV